MQEITRKVNLSSFPPSHHLLDPLEAILADQVHALDGVGLDHLVPGVLPDDLRILLALLLGPLVDDKLVVALQVEAARHLPPIGRHLVELLAQLEGRLPVLQRRRHNDGPVVARLLVLDGRVGGGHRLALDDVDVERVEILLVFVGGVALELAEEGAPVLVLLSAAHSGVVESCVE